MQKQELAEGMILYTFEPDPGRHFGYNIIALIDGKRALLIDTGYERHAIQVLQDLHNQEVVIEEVVLSHFHNDHMFGLKVLSHVSVTGSSRYKITLDLWTPPEEQRQFIPKTFVEKTAEINFGKHHLLLTVFPGHSECTMLIQINKKYLHIADELMFSNDGEPLLPSVDFHSSVTRHLESLKKLQAYSHLTMIPAHGRVFRGKETIEREINNRLAYLQAIESSTRQLTYEEATEQCDCEFLHPEWHKNTYR